MSDYRKEYREAQDEFFWTLPRAVLAILAVIVAVFLILVVTTPLTIGFGWFSGEANLRSFPHVAQTYQIAFDDAKGMDANVRQYCQFQASADKARAAGDTATANQRDTQALAVQSNYDRLKGEYDAYMQDHFRGKVLHPAQLPMPYPTFEARQKALCSK